LLLLSLNYNNGTFLRNYPEAFLIIEGDYDPVGLEAFKQKIYAEVGPQGNQRLPVLSTGDVGQKANLLKLRDTPREMEMPQMIRLVAALKCSAYRAHPSLLALQADQGENRAVISNVNDAFQIDLAQEEGLGSLLENFCSWLTRVLIEPVQEWADYELVPVLDPILGEKEVIEIWEKKLQMGHTVDEYRAALGDEPLAKVTNGAANGNYVNNQFFFEAAQQQQQALQQQIQALMPRQNPNGQQLESTGQVVQSNQRTGRDGIMPAGTEGYSGQEENA